MTDPGFSYISDKAKWAMNAERYISGLLYDYDCVIIPGFGGFVGNYTPAKIHPAHHTFTPPFKSLLFNVNLKQNDGLLASHIATAENISFSEALRKITSVAETWRQSLKNGKPVILDRIGRFYRDKEGNIQFEQDREVNYIPDSFGLSPFISPAIRRAGLQKKMERRITRYIDSSAGYRRIIPKSLKWAAILVLPIGIATIMGVMNFDRIKSLTQNYSGLIFARPYHTVSTISVPGNHRLNLQAGKTILIFPVPHITHPVPIISSLSADGTQATVKPYSIIVGAFLIRENADNLVARLQNMGFEASIIDVTKGGLHRVCLQSFADRNQALQQLAETRSGEFASAWLLQK